MQLHADSSHHKSMEYLESAISMQIIGIFMNELELNSSSFKMQPSSTRLENVAGAS